MCLLRWFYNNNKYKNVNDQWLKLDKTKGICSECYKYAYELSKYNKICYRCYDYYFYDNPK